MSTQRLRVAAVAAAIVLTLPARGVARTLAPLAGRSSPPAPAASDRTLVETSPAVVRTVSAPGGMSPAMRTALNSVDELFSPAARQVHVQWLPDGTMVLSSPSRFLNISVVGTDPDGVVQTRCVSSRDELLHVLTSGRPPAAAAEEE